MDNVTEVVALLRRQAELEQQLMTGRGIAVRTEQDLILTRRRLAAHPEALRAVLQTARALYRTPDAVSAQDVAQWSAAREDD
jgi:hypothetical protein